MKLYVRKRGTGEKVYLDLSARVRNDLRVRFGGDYFTTLNDGNTYNVKEVVAEKQVNNTAAGAIIGGLVGVLGGPIGLILGTGLGGVIGNNSDVDEQRRINAFNNSW